MAGNDINVRVGADIRQFSTGMQNVSRQLRGIDKKIGKFAVGLRAGFGLAAGAMVLAFGKKMAMMQAEFSASMSKVQAKTQATVGEMSRLTEFAREMGRTTPFSAKQAAEGMDFLAMAGFNTNQIMSALPATLRLASTANMDLGRSADIVSNILSQYGKDATETDKVVDMLAKTVTSHNTDMEQMSEAMKYIGPTAKALKIPLSQTAAVVGILADNGLQGSIGTRALGTALIRVNKPTKEMRESMRELGISFHDANGEFIGVDNMVQMLGESFAGMTTKQKQAHLSTLFGNEAIQEMNILLNAGSGKIREFTKEIQHSDGAAAKMAATMEDNLSGDLKKLNSAWEGLILGTGQFAEEMRGVVQVGTDFLNWLTGTTNEAEKLTDEWRKQKEALESNEAAAKPLIERYEELTGKEKKSKEETAELKMVTQKLADIYPRAIEGINQFGEATAISTKKIREFTKEQRAQLQVLNKDAISATLKQIIDNFNEIRKKREELAKGGVVQQRHEGWQLGDIFTGGWEEHDLGSDAGIREWRDEIVKLNHETAQMYLNLRDLGYELNEHQLAYIRQDALLADQVAAQKEVADSTEKVVEKTKEETEADLAAAEAKRKLAEARREALREKQKELAASIEKVNPMRPNLMGSLGAGAQRTLGDIPEAEGPSDSQVRRMNAAFNHQSLQEYNADMQTVMSGINDFFNQSMANRQARLDAYYDDERNKIMQSARSEEEKAKLIARLDEKTEKKRAELARKQALRDKLTNIAQATMNTALAVTKFLAMGRAGMAAVVGGLGAAQVAAISGTKIPQLASGGMLKRPAIVQAGEYAGAQNDPELFGKTSDFQKAIFGMRGTGGDAPVLVPVIDGDQVYVLWERAKERRDRYN